MYQDNQFSNTINSTILDVDGDGDGLIPCNPHWWRASWAYNYYGWLFDEMDESSPYKLSLGVVASMVGGDPPPDPNVLVPIQVLLWYIETLGTPNPLPDLSNMGEMMAVMIC